jgi:hypothetical protein
MRKRLKIRVDYRVSCRHEVNVLSRKKYVRSDTFWRFFGIFCTFWAKKYVVGDECVG